MDKVLKYQKILRNVLHAYAADDIPKPLHTCKRLFLGEKQSDGVIANHPRHSPLS